VREKIGKGEIKWRETERKGRMKINEEKTNKKMYLILWKSVAAKCASNFFFFFLNPTI
jgi:hypothetical protein